MPDWTASAYFADCRVMCPLEKAWTFLLNYRHWNPHFAGVDVTAIRGNASSEGEIVLIKDRVPYVKGEEPPEFYAETIRVIAPHRIVWCVYSKDRDAFRNIVDFRLSAECDGVTFNVSYYEQLRLSTELLPAHRTESQTVYEKLVGAFREFCEANA
jgi:hypothetical protein